MEVHDFDSSAEAIQKFKSQITQSLLLLNLMNTCDKEEVWKFWKTVSAAVKIAVNGRGNIMQTPKSQHKSLVPENDGQKHYLQELDHNAISVYVPSKPSKIGTIKYRILKFANQKKIADYYLEEAQHINSGVNDMKNKIKNSEDAWSDEDVESESKDVSPTQTAKPMSVRDLSDTKTLSVEKNSKSCPSSSKKIWPVGRPTTRSFTSVAKRGPTSNTVKIADNLNNCPSYRLAELQKNIQKNTIVCQSDLNDQGISQNFRDDLNAKTFQTEDNPDLLSTQVIISSNLKDNNISSQVKDNEEVVSIDSIATIDHTASGSIPAIEFYVKSGLDHSKEAAIDTNYKDAESYGAFIPFSENNNQASQSRNASDIETIISALEEELKKSANNLPSFSVIPHAKSWQLSSTEKVNSASQMGKTAENELVCAQELSSIDSSRGLNDSATNLLHSQTLCITQGSSEQEVDLSNDITLTGQPDHCVSRHANNSAVDEAADTVTIQTIPMKDAAYIDELGQTVADAGGEVTSSLNESGQQEQQLEGQEVVEVDGSIGIWACEGEGQAVQQLQDEEESVQVDESLPHNLEMDTSQILSDSQPVQAHYDVVEYEVLSDKRFKRGRKKKGMTEREQTAEDNETENSEVVDRTCPICHRVLNYASSMKAHMRIHTGARPYSCGQCDRKFTTKANRDRHEATHVGLKPFQCLECHKSFTEKRSLKIHMRSHTGERPYVCEICGQGFAQKCTLQVHKVRHTDKRAHLCDLCGKAFRQKNQLEVHVKRHKRQAAFPCEHCEIRCYTKGDLMRHMVKHTGERPYICKLCPRAFTRKQYLLDHENQHYNRKPYSCSECGMSFHDMGSCHRHLRKHKNSKEENKEAPVRTPHQLPILNVDVVQKMMSTAKPGQVLKLEDGSDAVVKEVTSDTDGSTVYHITCLNLVNTPTPTAALSHYHQNYPHHQQEGLQPENSQQQFVHIDTLSLSQGAIIKVEDSEDSCENHTEEELQEALMSDFSKVEDLDGLDTGNQ